MPKTQSSIGVNEGTAKSLSTFELASGRQRQTVIIGDADDAGEQLLVELPSHGTADRGSSVKIGGQVRGAPFTGLVNGDRTDAWFTTSGSLAVVNTVEPATIYDAGRQSIIFLQVNIPALTGAATSIVSATGGQRIKVLGVHVVCSSVGAAGTLFLTDGSPADLLAIERFTTTGARTIGFGGQNIVQTAVGTALGVRYDAAASAFFMTVAYYKAA